MIHLRYTPDDISGYTFDFLDSMASRYIVARELLDDKKQPLLHYHVLIETDYGEKSIRDAAKAALKIPKSGRGKNNKYYALFEDWKDPSYICKYNDIVCSKGYASQTLLEYSIEGAAKYLNEDECLIEDEKPQSQVSEVKTVRNKVQPVETQVSTEILVWYNEQLLTGNEEPTKRQMVEKACALWRSHGKGINKFKVRDTVVTLLYDVNSHRDSVVSDILNMC